MQNIETLIHQLTLQEKVALLAGTNTWYTVPVERLGIPSLKMSDGPNGARGAGGFSARDVAQSCRLALETDISGAEAFIIAAADSVMTRPSRELLAEVYPGVPLRGEIGEFESLLSSEKARKMLGYRPQFSWRATS